jgi:hypothetical protein
MSHTSCPSGHPDAGAGQADPSDRLDPGGSDPADKPDSGGDGETPAADTGDKSNDRYVPL